MKNEEIIPIEKGWFKRLLGPLADHLVEFYSGNLTIVLDENGTRAVCGDLGIIPEPPPARFGCCDGFPVEDPAYEEWRAATSATKLPREAKFELGGLEVTVVNGVRNALEAAGILK